MINPSVFALAGAVLQAVDADPRTSLQQRLTANANPQMLDRARSWSACVDAGKAERECLREARSNYERCLRAAVRHPATRRAGDGKAVPHAMGMCEPEWEDLAVAASLASVSGEERTRYRMRMRATVERDYREDVRRRPDRRESCAAEAGCSPGQVSH